MAGNNREYVNVTAKPANDTPFAFTLREMTELAISRRFWLALGGIVVVLSVAGPFNTFASLSLPERALYWAVTATGSFAVGIFFSMLITLHAQQAGAGPKLALLLGGLVAGIPIAVLNAVIIHVVFGDAIVPETWSILPYTAAISVTVSFLYELLSPDDEDGIEQPADASDTAPPMLFAKLPMHLGQDIVHLQAQDHYVKVMTPKGSALVLMRIGDAERDLKNLGGVRTHRSWWVSKRHAVKVQRGDGKLHVTTSLGTEVPVGRAYRQQVLSFFQDA